MITISFQTQYLPAPFAYAYVLRLDQEGILMKYDFEIEYLDREHLSEDEIISEGAEPQAFLSYSGELTKNWTQYLNGLLKEAILLDKQPEHKDYLYFDLEDGRSGFAKDTEFWMYTFQELIQCIYELNQKEQPLHIRILLNSNEERQELVFRGKFSNREFEINEKNYPWEKLRSTLSFFENFELNEKPLENSPSKKGMYIDYGDGLFFRVKSIKEEDNLQQMIALLHEKIA